MAVAVWWFYKKANYGPKIVPLLKALRFIVLVGLAILLLRPLIESVSREIEKPKLAVVWDNSSSMLYQSEKEMGAFKDSVQQVINQDLNQKFEIESYSFDSDLKLNNNPDFTGTNSNLSAAVEGVATLYKPNDLYGCILISDGIVNQGLDPSFLPPTFYKMYTLGLGDTSKVLDFKIERVDHNKTAFKDNAFPIKINWAMQSMSATQGVIRLSKDGKTIQEKEVKLEGAKGSLTLYYREKELGNHLYKVEFISPTADKIPENNQAFFSVKILEKKVTLAFIYDAPTPDLGAFVQALNNYEDIAVELISLNKLSNSDFSKYEAGFLFLAKSAQKQQLEKLQGFRKDSKGLFVFLRTEQQASVLRSLGIIPNLQLEAASNQENLVYPIKNEEFSGLSLAEEWTKTTMLSPLKVQLGSPKAAPAYNAVFHQQIGSLKSKLPLLLYSQNEKGNVVVSLAWDWWKLRMSFFQEFASHKAFDEWVASAVPFIGAKGEKEKLKINIPDFFIEQSKQGISAELYNSIGDPVSGQEISLKLINQQQEFDFSFLSSGSAYYLNLNGLKAGNYSYRAEAKVEGETIVKQGSFAVLPGNIEKQNLTADHNLLKRLSEKSGGKFYNTAEWSNLITMLANNVVPGILKTEKSRAELVEWKWLLFLFVGLLGCEWYLRKLKGNQ